MIWVMSKQSEVGRPDSLQAVTAPAGKLELLQLLDSEIDHIRSQIEAPGWSPWALTVAIGYVLWLFLQELEGESISRADARTIVVVAVSLSLLLWAVRFLATATRYEHGSSEGSLRFGWAPAKLGSARLGNLLTLLQSAVLAAATWHYSGDLPRPLVAIALAAYSLVFLAAALLVGISFSRFPLPVADSRWWHKPLSLVVALFFLGLGASYLISLGAVPTPQHVRIAGLAVGVYYLARILAGLDRTPPLLGSLITIRRQVTLDSVDLSAAAEQTEIALIGLRVSELVQPQIRAILRNLNAAAQETRVAAKLFEPVEANLQQLLLLGQNKLHEAQMLAAIDALRMTLDGANADRATVAKPYEAVLEANVNQLLRLIEAAAERGEVSEERRKVLAATLTELLAGFETHATGEWFDVNQQRLGVRLEEALMLVQDAMGDEHPSKHTNARVEDLYQTFCSLASSIRSHLDRSRRFLQEARSETARYKRKVVLLQKLSSRDIGADLEELHSKIKPVLDEHSRLTSQMTDREERITNRFRDQIRDMEDLISNRTSASGKAELAG